MSPSTDSSHKQKRSLQTSKRVQSRKEHHRTNIQSQDPMREIPAASAEYLPCIHRLQDGFWQSMVRSLMGSYEDIQQKGKHHTSQWKSACAVLFSGSTGDWFRCTVVVRQGYLLSPTLFNIYLERIVFEALFAHECSVTIGGRLMLKSTPKAYVKIEPNKIPFSTTMYIYSL